MQSYLNLRRELALRPRTWLVTGVAGFIGCNLLKELLRLDQRVVGLDNFATGQLRNLNEIEAAVKPHQWANFCLVTGDIRDLDVCRETVREVDYVLHQAALGSVPRSIEDPIRTNQANIDGFLNMLVASRDAGVKRFVFASSSSTYGDHPDLPKTEDRIGKPLSPYAVTKYVNELYAAVFAQTYGVEAVGLRYFNIFGPHQDPNGPYAAVIPKWTAAMLQRETVYINGDGETSRDFCYIANAVQANLLAGAADRPGANGVYNVAVGERTTLNELYLMIKTEIEARVPGLRIAEPQYRDFREGDVRHSLACIDRARAELGYEPTHRAAAGMKEAMEWYLRDMAAVSPADSSTAR
ncbi:MAG: SDR family oxidoreductase [Gemmatimonadaceae bacterium]|nr:SDR family oxidoreductase [Gemmatimonadaceae bacterium]